MLDEHGLAGKLDILGKWMAALERGDYQMTPRGMATFRAVLEQCHAEAVKLEAIEAMALSAMIAGAREQIGLGRAAVAAGLLLVEVDGPPSRGAGVEGGAS